MVGWNGVTGPATTVKLARLAVVNEVVDVGRTVTRLAGRSGSRSSCVCGWLSPLLWVMKSHPSAGSTA
jgi:hypothetical protein